MSGNLSLSSSPQETFKTHPTFGLPGNSKYNQLSRKIEPPSDIKKLFENSFLKYKMSFSQIKEGNEKIYVQVPGCLLILFFF